MAKNKEGFQKPETGLTPDEITRDEAIAAKYDGDPSPRALLTRGDIEREDYDRVARLRDAGPPDRAFRSLITELRTARERQGLSLEDVAARSGMDRAAIHKIEIGVNKNPTVTTLIRYAEALGQHIEWHVVEGIKHERQPSNRARTG